LKLFLIWQIINGMQQKKIYISIHIPTLCYLALSITEFISLCSVVSFYWLSLSTTGFYLLQCNSLPFLPLPCILPASWLLGHHIQFISTSVSSLGNHIQFNAYNDVLHMPCYCSQCLWNLLKKHTEHPYNIQVVKRIKQVFIKDRHCLF